VSSHSRKSMWRCDNADDRHVEKSPYLSMSLACGRGRPGLTAVDLPDRVSLGRAGFYARPRKPCAIAQATTAWCGGRYDLESASCVLPLTVKMSTKFEVDTTVRNCLVIAFFHAADILRDLDLLTLVSGHTWLVTRSTHPLGFKLLWLTVLEL